MALKKYKQINIQKNVHNFVVPNLENMKANDYTGLEKDLNFKRIYIANTLWWKNMVMLPPVLFMFIGLAGLLYLFQLDKLLSFYAIPYLLLFSIGTIWLKAMKKHLQKTMMAQPGAFHICLAASIGEKDGYTYTAFVNDRKRHDQQYITKLAKELSFHEIVSDKAAYKKKAIRLNKENDDTCIYIKAYNTKSLIKRNAGWSFQEGYVPILFINEDNVPIIKRKHLIGKK